MNLMRCVLLLGIFALITPATGFAAQSEDEKLCDEAWLGHDWPRVAVRCESGAFHAMSEGIDVSSEYDIAKQDGNADDNDRELAYLDFVIAAKEQARSAIGQYRLHDRTSALAARDLAKSYLKKAAPYANSSERVNLAKENAKLSSSNFFAVWDE